MAEVDPALLKQLRAHPEQRFDLILRVEGDSHERGEALARRGVDIKRRYRLTHTLSVRCSGKLALDLLGTPWITRIESDRPVKALER